MISEPAVGKTFFGRDDALQILQKRVNALKGGYRQNVALTGQMLSGKSSILYQLLYTLKDPSLVPVYIEVVEEPFRAFADRFIATLLYNYLISCGHEAAKELGELMNVADRYIPHTVYAIKKVKADLARKNHNGAYRKLLSLTSVLKKETGKSCIVILDEFHNLEFFKVRKPYLHFGKIMMIQKDTMYIVSSSQKSTIKKILSEKLALLFGNFEILEIEGFDDRTAGEFLKEKLGFIGIDRSLMEYLIEFTDGNPFYLDVIAKKIAALATLRKLSYAGKDIVAETLVILMHQTSGTINQYFTNTIMTLLDKGFRKDYLDVLTALASGCNKLKDIAAYFKKKSASGFARKLSALVEIDMVYKSGVFYGLRDKVLEFWLKMVYHKKKTSLVDEIVNKTEDFKNAVLGDIDEYLAESQKDTVERISELFGNFNGETVEIEKKERRLPRFAKIERVKYGDSEGLMGEQGGNKYWVCQVGRARMDESSVSDFIEHYYPMRRHLAKKICIALEGMDTNALLLAKEKNIWVWDLKRIKGLLRLYRKRNIIYR